jgi:dihydrofolate reductase
LAAKVVFGARVSLDGYVADASGDHSQLYPDFEHIAENAVVKEAIERTGAVVMGRGSFDLSEGDWTGYEFQTPIFVVTHDPPSEPVKGENDRLSIEYETGGVEAAVERAREAAGDRDVQVIGQIVGQQCLAAGLVDELSIGVMPMLLGRGKPMFAEMVDPPALERISVVETPADTELRFRVAR